MKRKSSRLFGTFGFTRKIAWSRALIEDRLILRNLRAQEKAWEAIMRLIIILCTFSLIIGCFYTRDGLSVWEGFKQRLFVWLCIRYITLCLWSHYRVKSRFSNLNRDWSKSLCDRTNYPFEDLASKYDKQNKLESLRS